ncbi:MAG: hypothetical protein JO233_01875 [Candidatus Eremiobacteraeota bacterium]|nr:hypothetical protein [Candidatus Eremiobacteraeota bacterium]
MKVTASAPVWAWGNWYQSEAYHLGEHDRRELEFSTALLQTQSRFPVMQSEFQAGWLQGPEQAHPRRVSPQNTPLALHTLLQSGAHGIVNFPVQDTLYPGGWEAPFANASYAWDAALTLDGQRNARYSPTAQFGRLVSMYGGLLAQTHRLADAAVAYSVSAYDPSQIDGARLDAIVTASRDALTDCRTLRLTCDLVDLRYSRLQDLARYRYLVIPRLPNFPRIDPTVAGKLRRYQSYGHIAPSVVQLHMPQHVVNISNAVLLVSNAPGKYTFLDILNYDSRPHNTGPIRLHIGSRPDIRLPSVRVAAASGMLIPLNARPDRVKAIADQSTTSIAPCDTTSALRFAGVCWPMAMDRIHNIGGKAIAFMDDVTQDGEPWLILANAAAKLGIAPAAGARAFVFQNGGDNAFTTTGGLRDDVDPAPTPSPRDYISAYTHQFPAGTFNRPYDCRILNSGNRAEATCAYSAPDLKITFERNLLMQPDQPAFSLRLRLLSASPSVRGVLLSGLAISQSRSVRQPPYVIADGTARYAAGATVVVQGSALGMYDPLAHMVATVSWPFADKLDTTIQEKADSAIVRFEYAANAWHDVSFGYYAVAGLAAAQRIVQSLKGAQSGGANGR